MCLVEGSRNIILQGNSAESLFFSGQERTRTVSGPGPGPDPIPERQSEPTLSYSSYVTTGFIYLSLKVLYYPTLHTKIMLKLNLTLVLMIT